MRWLSMFKRPQAFFPAPSPGQEVAVYHTESWGRVCALWFKLVGTDEEILEYVERVAHPHREPANEREARIRRDLDRDYRFLTYASVVRIGPDTEYELTREGWQRLPSVPRPANKRPQARE
jgi:hypothetical protein